MFNAHCSYSIEVKQHIMFCTMEGAWNTEGTREYFQAVKNAARPIIETPWVRIADTRNFEGGPLEVMQVLIEIQQWSLANNCKKLIIVAAREMNKNIIDQNRSEYAGMQMVDSIEEANILASGYLDS